MKQYLMIPTEISVSAPNKTHLVKTIHHVIKEMSGMTYQHDETNDNSYFMQLTRHDCKCVYKYRTEEEVPEISLFCKHGNQIIRYTDEEKLN